LQTLDQNVPGLFQGLDIHAPDSLQSDNFQPGLGRLGLQGVILITIISW
jgi:hypothetical protein